MSPVTNLYICVGDGDSHRVERDMYSSKCFDQALSYEQAIIGVLIPVKNSTVVNFVPRIKAKVSEYVFD